MPRRGNGEGSIYQRKSDGLWVGAYKGADNRRHFLYGRTRSAVRDRLVVALRDAQQGVEPGPARLTFGGFLDQWLEAIKPTVRPRTLESYSDMLRLHVRPDLGSIALTRLTASEIHRLLGRKLSGGLSPRTVQYIHAIVRRALGHAEKWGLIPRNVARLVEGPRVRRPEIAPLTPTEVRLLLAYVRGKREEALYTVAIAMGLRPGGGARPSLVRSRP